ncbi:MAG: capsule assembly Wzi family protein [Candidatus Omnitrophota bacterium]
MRLFLSVTLFIVFFYAAALEASPSIDVPLDHWSYEAIEKLSILGLCDIADIGVRPVSRIKMAHIIKTAIDKASRYELDFEWDQQDHLELLLNNLIEEFRPDLVDIGVDLADVYDAPPPVNIFRPIDKINIKKVYGRLDSDSMALDNKEGWFLEDGLNVRGRLTGWARASNLFAMSVSPGVRYTSKDTDFDVENALFRVNPLGMNLELAVGRNSMWLGPGFHGSLLMSNNAFPLDMVRFNNITPFRLPWLLRKIGRFGAVFFVSRLDQEGDVQDPWLSGWRVDYTPWGFLKFGFGHALMFGGKGMKRISGSNFFAANSLVFSAAGGDSERENHIISGDAQLFIRRIDRFLPIATGAKFYTEWGAEDEAGNIPADLASIIGVYIMDLFKIPGFDINAEMAKFHKVWYTHYKYTSGYRNRGGIIGHHAGGDSEDVSFSAIFNSPGNFKMSGTYSYQRGGLSRANVETAHKFIVKFSLIDALNMYNIKDTDVSIFYDIEDIENYENSTSRVKNHVVGAEIMRKF